MIIAAMPLRSACARVHASGPPRPCMQTVATPIQPGTDALAPLSALPYRPLLLLKLLRRTLCLLPAVLEARRGGVDVRDCHLEKGGCCT